MVISAYHINTPISHLMFKRCYSLSSQSSTKTREICPLSSRYFFSQLYKPDCIRITYSLIPHTSIFRRYRSVPAGGNGYDADKVPRRPYFSANVMNIVSSDHAGIKVSSALAQLPFLKVLCFNSAFEQRFVSEKIIHLLLFLSMQRKLVKDKGYATEITKIIVSDKAFDRPAQEMASIQDADFLTEHADPASSSVRSWKTDDE
ncbi:hypothetical protein HD806DRAFT_520674 [Xylariaceae sp. AK1471]|nr:hypothetical protein HD806DRAFT_520674 [Xylariaceae sp. AK1471]